jgi:hypothetical protein
VSAALSNLAREPVYGLSTLGAGPTGELTKRGAAGGEAAALLSYATLAGSTAPSAAAASADAAGRAAAADALLAYAQLHGGADAGTCRRRQDSDR